MILRAWPQILGVLLVAFAIGAGLVWLVTQAGTEKLVYRFQLDGPGTGAVHINGEPIGPTPLTLPAEDLARLLDPALAFDPARFDPGDPDDPKRVPTYDGTPIHLRIESSARDGTLLGEGVATYDESRGAYLVRLREDFGGLGLRGGFWLRVVVAGKPARIVKVRTAGEESMGSLVVERILTFAGQT